MYTDNELEQNINKAQYYNLKPFKMVDPHTNKIAKKYVFTKYNPEISKEELAFKKVAGYISKITLGEPKDCKTKEGKPFVVQNLFIELNAYKNGKLERGVIVINKRSKVFEIVVSKLANLTDFSWITFEGYTFKDKSGQYRQTVLLKNNEGKSLLKRIHFKYNNATYEQPENLIEIPPFEMVKDDEGQPILSEDGRVQAHPVWMDKKNKIYLKALDDIIKINTEWVQKNPLQEDNQPIKTTKPVEQVEMDQPQSFGEPVQEFKEPITPPTDEELNKILDRPPIDQDHEYIPETNVLMPF
jgi:hypothetical protein